MLIASLLVSLAAVPMADVSPFAVKPLPDGALEYSYDLTPLKSAGGSPDAVQVHGEAKVKAFLKRLPNTARLRVEPGAPWEVTAGRGVETGRLAISFAGVADNAIDSDNPLAIKKGAKLRPPLDPAEPKVLLSAEAVAWEVRQVELAALAAEEVDTEALRRELWNRVLAQAINRHQNSSGDVREGSLALAARVAAGAACLDGSKVPVNVRSDADASTATDAEISRLSSSADALVAPVPWSWRPELACAWIRMQVMSQPFERSRAGSAAVLLFLDMLVRDPKLGALWEKLRARRDKFLGTPATEPISLWKEKTKGEPARSLEGLNEFLESLPVDERVPPGLVGAAVTPFTKFLFELDGVERRDAFEELANALADGRVNPRLESWPAAREAQLAALCQPDAIKSIRFDGDWRDRLQGAFSNLQGSASEGRARGAGIEREDGERSKLEVRLLVPPSLEVEPLPELYARAASSLERLVQALQSEQLNGLQGRAFDGSSTGPVVTAAKTLIPRLHGLAALANPDTASAKEVAEGRRWSSAWRKDPALGRDVREAAASPVAMSSERAHAAVVGVSRRELAVSYGKPPKISVVGKSVDGVVFQPSEQRYIVPVLVTVGSSAGPRVKPMERAKLKSLIDGADRDAHQVEGAFAEALKN
ncbi:MAG: hypothetical protein DI536_14310 [Archangium gephyra]|uniref:Uncharacterized protein n=1 Tax=Archangium gephyra TaxID=48 RepID=A0A2W5TCY1_9BACT|nr:MAG: hypothetical protein DI536_14310 [Archangium gephyra]